MRQPVTVYHLEMTEPEQHVRARPPETEYVLQKMALPCPELNRFFYATVGADWYWFECLGWSRAQWLDWLERESIATWIAYVQGTPAGYFELALQPGRSVEIAHFGLLPSFIGRGLGGPLLSDAINQAWGRDAQRVWLHTCSLDHPAALPNYKARGFRLFKIEELEQEVPDEPLAPWPGY